MGAPLGFLSERVSLNLAISLFAAIAYSLVWIAIAELPETKATELRA